MENKYNLEYKYPHILQQQISRMIVDHENESGFDKAGSSTLTGLWALIERTLDEKKLRVILKQLPSMVAEFKDLTEYTEFKINERLKDKTKNKHGI